MNKKANVIMITLFLLLLAIVTIIAASGNDATTARTMDTNHAFLATVTAAACQATVTAHNAGYPTPTPDCNLAGAKMNNPHVEDLPIPFLTATAIAWNAQQASLEFLCEGQYRTAGKTSAR